MTQITLDLPEEMMIRLHGLEEKLTEIMELGIREFNASNQMGFKGFAEVLEFLVSLPSPEEIIALHPTPDLQNKIDSLLEKNRHGNLTQDEKKLWQQYQYLEHLVRLAKAKAYIKLQEKPM
ncbi:hypothetical protein ACN4EE_08105 [Geminocystis sp. CENA526]|uniref:hypothetical protein n=1 Tax=Geminocystis sp. CENA526 TaxID=1355871 RepID=UPI003D6EB4F7